ncbi:hypothetical protein SKAU_G00065470 [Synaphobranchus kaupii]|uniref:Uncharacterized protein n=1 Tax=Synaphobranchus kaupii TaxID=118154 RepID=A0A9Q1G5S6_SYNKA|nr:hypothetical protein SKAU_G00065470 [Synaphobranchus kaupii]
MIERFLPTPPRRREATGLRTVPADAYTTERHLLWIPSQLRHSRQTKQHGELQKNTLGLPGTRQNKTNAHPCGFHMRTQRRRAKQTLDGRRRERTQPRGARLKTLGGSERRRSAGLGAFGGCDGGPSADCGAVTRRLVSVCELRASLKGCGAKAAQAALP